MADVVAVHSEVHCVRSKIERVEVFRQSALVTRRAHVELQPGDATLQLEGLPVSLRDDSLRVALPKSDARIVDVHMQWAIASRDRPLASAATIGLQQLERKQTTLGVARQRALAMVKLLETLSPTTFSPTDMPEDLAFKERNLGDAWLQLADYVRESAREARKEARRLERELRDLEDAISRAQDDLDRESDADTSDLGTLKKAARVQLADAPAAFDLEVSYLVPNAQWVPEYDLRVHEHDNVGELVLRALVAQRTGEDWQQIALDFSTADLHRSTDSPELDSWRIGKAQPPKRSGWRPLPDTLGELFVDYDLHVGSLPDPDVPDFPDLPASPHLAASRAAPKRKPRKSKPRRDRRAEMEVEEVSLGSGMMAANTAEPIDEMPKEPSGALADLCFDEEMEIEMAMVKEADIDSFGDAPLAASAAPSAPGMVMRSAAPAPQMAKKSDRRKQRSRAGGGPPPEPQPEIEPELIASEEALSYSNLRMQGPDDSGRGELRAAGFTEQLSGVGAYELGALLGSQTLRISLPEHAVAVEHSAGHFATRYHAEGRAQLPADGRLHAVPLLRRQAPIERVYRCVPSVDAHVYELALFKNPLRVPLLSGPVRIYRGGDFVVTAPMTTTAPEKSLTVNLGLEPGIVVARNTHFEEKSGGLFGGGSLLQHKIEIEVNNKLGRSVRVEIFERIPTSNDKEIEVELTRSQPKAEKYDQRERSALVHGGYKLAVDLGPKSKQTCILEYQINLPSKRVLVGGNRRD